MPKVLVVGEKAYFIHSFEEAELNALEITHTRNHSTYTIGHTLDDPDMSEESLNAIRSDVMMMLKQSGTWKKAHHNKEMDGFSLLIFRGKNHNAKKSYIANWCGQSKAEMLTQDPPALIQQLVYGFKDFLDIKQYHKKSHIHDFFKNK